LSLEQEGGTVKKKYILAGVFALVIVVALLAVACGGGEATTTTIGEPTTTLPPATGEPIKIGHIVNETGIEAQTGKNMAQSLELAFNEVGMRIGDRPIELITENAGDSAEEGLARVKKLVEQDKVDVIFGPTEIAQKFSVAQYMKTAANPVPVIFYSPAQEFFTTDNPWVLGAGGSNLQQATCMADYVYEVLGYRKIVTLGPEGAAGANFVTPFADEFKLLGGTVVDQVWPPETALDMSPFLTTLKDADADALCYWFPGANAQKLIVAFYQLGITIPKVGIFHGATFDPWVFQTLNNPEAAAAMEGVPVSMEYGPDAQTEANQHFADLWAAAYPTKSGPQCLDGSTSNPYDAAQWFIKALQSNGLDTTPEAMRTALLATEWDGPQGPAFFDANGKNAAFKQIATRNMYIVKVVASPAGSEYPYHYETLMTYLQVPPTGYEDGVTQKIEGAPGAAAAAETTTTAAK
jgi:branched-chain amino acid transport system substrate-binding protein